MDGKDGPSYTNGNCSMIKAVCRSQPIIIIQKQSSKLVANTRGSNPCIHCDGTANQASVERGLSEQSKDSRPPLSSGNNNHGAGGQVDPIPKEMLCDHGRNHENINLVASEGKSSQETTCSGHNSQSNAHENQGTVTMRNCSHDIPLRTGSQGTGRAPDSSGNGAPAYYDKLASSAHEGTVHKTNISPTSKTLSVTHPAVHHYSLEYRWSPMLKYCKRKEIYCGHTCSGEALH